MLSAADGELRIFGHELMDTALAAAVCNGCRRTQSTKAVGLMDTSFAAGYKRHKKSPLYKHAPI